LLVDKEYIHWDHFMAIYVDYSLKLGTDEAIDEVIESLKDHGL
jgi:hypothetical protein